jgi:hypothetical protein
MHGIPDRDSRSKLRRFTSLFSLKSTNTSSYASRNPIGIGVIGLFDQIFSLNQSTRFDLVLSISIAISHDTTYVIYRYRCDPIKHLKRTKKGACGCPTLLRDPGRFTESGTQVSLKRVPSWKKYSFARRGLEFTRTMATTCSRSSRGLNQRGIGANFRRG